jgi:hypothetical protein
MRTLPTLGLCLAVTAGAIGAYDALRGARPAAVPPEVARLDAEVAALRSERDASRSGAALLRRLIALEARVEALAAGGGGDDGLTLERLQGMLDQLQARARAEKSEAAIRRRLQEGGVLLTEEDERVVVPLLVGYTDRLLEMRQRMRTQPPREVVRGAREDHARMHQELDVLVGPAAAARIIDLFPEPPEPPEPRGPRAPDAGEAGRDGG